MLKVEEYLSNYQKRLGLSHEAGQQVYITPNVMLFNLISSSEPNVFRFVLIELPSTCIDIKFTVDCLAQHLFHHLWVYLSAFSDGF